MGNVIFSLLDDLGKYGHPDLIALVQGWRRQYGSRVDVDMFASP
jgi:hypothetical protein